MKNSIKVERASRNITQAELADSVKVSRQTIIAVESGKYVPSATLAIRIARYFHKPVEAIFEVEETD